MCSWIFHILVYLLCKNCNPSPPKSHFLFSSNPLLKIEILSSPPPPFLNLVGGSPPLPPAERVGGYTLCSVDESSGSQFLRTTTGIKSGLHAFNKSRFVKILCDTEMLCSFRLVLEGKTGKEIPESSRLEFLKKFLANSFDLSNAGNNIFWLLNKRDIADLTLLRTLLAICQKSWEPSSWEVISMNYGGSTSSWKPWRRVRLDLILMMRNIYINPNPNPLTKVTSSSRSTKLKDVFPWNFSQIITKTINISKRIIISYIMKWGILFWVWRKVSGN